MTDNKELKALITLLEDPNTEVFELVKQKLQSMGSSIISHLEKAWDNTLNKLLKNRLEELIQEIQFTELNTSIKNWAKKDSSNLLLGSYLVSKYKYPDLKIDDIKSQIEKIIADVNEIYDEKFTPLEKIKAINHILFGIHRFSRNEMHFYAVNNSYINKVLETRKGNSITLGIIYILVAQALKLPIYGVNLPKNFILAFMNENAENKNVKDNVLFYINPFSKGAVLGRNEIDHFLIQHKLTHKNQYYTPCNTSDIIHRLLLSLIFSYTQVKQNQDVKAIEFLKKTLLKNN